MKIIIAGSRTIDNMDHLIKAINDSKFNITTVICGMARGVDTLGYNWAIKNNIPIEKYPAEWDYYGKRAGYIRNSQMGTIADALILVWDGKSSGSLHMKNIMKKLNKPIYEYIVK